MKDYVKDIAERANGNRKYVSPVWSPVWQFFDDELEHFAELLIRECLLELQATAVFGVKSEEYEEGFWDCYRQIDENIRKKFGVE